MQTPLFGEKTSKKHVILVFILIFLSLIVYIFKNFSQIFADMSACLSDNKLIFTRENQPKLINLGTYLLILHCTVEMKDKQELDDLKNGVKKALSVNQYDADICHPTRQKTEENLPLKSC